MQQPWTTSVTRIEPDEVYVRGYGIQSLIGQASFAAATYLLVRGELPTPAQARVMDAVLCSVLDYGLQKPGTVAARFCVSGNPSMTAGLATAVLSVGAYTLAPDEAGEFILRTLAEAKDSGLPPAQAAAALAEATAKAKQRVPGFGHPTFRVTDPRAQKLKEIAQGGGVWGEACDWYEAVHQAFTARVGKPDLVINEVGMMAAILVQMGFTPQEMTGLAIISSLPGVIAHISEELKTGTRIRTLPESLIETSVNKREIFEGLALAGWGAGD